MIFLIRVEKHCVHGNLFLSNIRATFPPLSSSDHSMLLKLGESLGLKENMKLPTLIDLNAFFDPPEAFMASKAAVESSMVSPALTTKEA